VFDTESRYTGLPTATHTLQDGRQIVYVTRRFLPRAAALVPIGRVLVGEDDRLDQIAARTIGDPFQYWRVCDANEAMNPDDLVRRPGSTLLICDVP
jgi:hypothetical protein